MNNAAHMKANSSNSANAEVSDANNLLLWKHLALTHTDQGVLVIDPQQRVRYFNPRVCVLLDVSAELLATQPTIQAFTQWQSARGDFGPQDAALEASLRDYIQRVSQGGPDEPPTTTNA